MFSGGRDALFWSSDGFAFYWSDHLPSGNEKRILARSLQSGPGRVKATPWFIVKGKRISCPPQYGYRDHAKRAGRLRQRHGFEHGFPSIRSPRASAQGSTTVLFSFLARSARKQVDDHSGGHGIENCLQDELSPKNMPPSAFDKKRQPLVGVKSKRQPVPPVSASGSAATWNDHHRDEHRHANCKQCWFHHVDSITTRREP